VPCVQYIWLDFHAIFTAPAHESEKVQPLPIYPRFVILNVSHDPMGQRNANVSDTCIFPFLHVFLGHKVILAIRKVLSGQGRQGKTIGERVITAIVVSVAMALPIPTLAFRRAYIHDVAWPWWTTIHELELNCISITQPSTVAHFRLVFLACLAVVISLALMVGLFSKMPP
jgi:uncharacterized membrane protein YhaH (DUF805 family)